MKFDILMAVTEGDYLRSLQKLISCMQILYSITNFLGIAHIVDFGPLWINIFMYKIANISACFVITFGSSKSENILLAHELLYPYFYPLILWLSSQTEVPALALSFITDITVFCLYFTVCQWSMKLI